MVCNEKVCAAAELSLTKIESLTKKFKYFKGSWLKKLMNFQFPNFLMFCLS